MVFRQWPVTCLTFDQARKANFRAGGQNKSDTMSVVWLRPTYTQEPNFGFACQVLRFDAERRGRDVRKPRFEFSNWEPDTHTFSLCDEHGEIARMSFMKRTVRWTFTDHVKDAQES